MIVGLKSGYLKGQTIIGNVPSKSNQYRISGNRLYKTKAVKDYERGFALQYKRHETIRGGFGLSIKAYLVNNRQDLDNLLKVCLDMLESVGAIENDSFCERIEATKFIDKTNPRIEIELKPLLAQTARS